MVRFSFVFQSGGSLESLKSLKSLNSLESLENGLFWKDPFSKRPLFPNPNKSRKWCPRPISVSMIWGWCWISVLVSLRARDLKKWNLAWYFNPAWNVRSRPYNFGSTCTFSPYLLCRMLRWGWTSSALPQHFPCYVLIRWPILGSSPLVKVHVSRRCGMKLSISTFKLPHKK